MKFPVERCEIRDVEPSVQCGDLHERLPAREQEVQIVNMEVQYVETVSQLEDVFEHQDVVCHLVHAIFVQAKRLWTDSHKLC